MSDETTETTEVVEESKDTGKGLRAQLEAALSKNKDYESRERDRAFKAIGLDPTTGFGKAIAQVYTGDPSEEAVTKFAKDEYGYEFTAPETTHPQAAQIHMEQSRLDQLGQTSGSVVDASNVDVLAKAEAEGDYATTMAIKGQQIADMFRGKR